MTIERDLRGFCGKQEKLMEEKLVNLQAEQHK